MKDSTKEKRNCNRVDDASVRGSGVVLRWSQRPQGKGKETPTVTMMLLMLAYGAQAQGVRITYGLGPPLNWEWLVPCKVPHVASCRFLFCRGAFMCFLAGPRSALLQSKLFLVRSHISLKVKGIQTLRKVVQLSLEGDNAGFRKLFFSGAIYLQGSVRRNCNQMPLQSPSMGSILLL